MEESAEPIVSADMQVCDRGGIGDRFWQWMQWSGARDAPMGSVTIVVSFVFAQGVQQVRTVPDQHAVEEFVAAGLDPPLDDRVHPGNSDAAEHDGDTGVGEDGVEQVRVLAIPVADEVLHLASGVVEVHDEVAGGLGHPRCGRVGGGAEDAYPGGWRAR